MSNECKDWLNDLDDIQRKNYELCMKYPILIPTDIRGVKWKDYFYECTELDKIPKGWRTAFGESWAKELQDAINTLPEDSKDRVYIMDLKEKFGQFRQYLSYYSEDIRKVIRKYEELSMKTCIDCGEPATHITLGWISPYCEKCLKTNDCVTIEEYFKEQEIDED